MDNHSGFSRDEWNRKMLFRYLAHIHTTNIHRPQSHGDVSIVDSFFYRLKPELMIIWDVGGVGIHHGRWG